MSKAWTDTFLSESDVTEASPTGYPDETLYKVTLVRFEPTKKVPVMRILRDSGMTLQKVRENIRNLPWVLYDPWVPGEEPRWDEALDALKEFGGELEFTRWTFPDESKHAPEECVSVHSEQGTKVSFEFGGLNANGDVLPSGVMHADIPSSLQKDLGCAGPVSMGSSQKGPLAEAIQEAREKCKTVNEELKATENLYRNFIPSRDYKAAIVIQILLAEVELLKAGEPGVDYPVSGGTNPCQEVEIGPMSPKDLE